MKENKGPSVSTSSRTPRPGRILDDVSVAQGLKPQRVQIFDPFAIKDALETFDGDDPLQDVPDAALSSEELQWRCVLRKLASDPQGGMRDVLIGTPDMLERLENVERLVPHMSEATGIIRRAIDASITTSSRLRIPHLLLEGPPGCAKSFAAKQFSEVFGLRPKVLDLSMANDRGIISGYSKSWRGARPSGFVSALTDRHAKTSSPFIILEEADKADARERLLPALLSPLEPETSCVYVDEYVTDVATFRLDHAIVVMTANDMREIPAPLLDRVLPIKVKPPQGRHLSAIIQSIYRVAIAEYAGYFEPNLAEDVMPFLSSRSPREVRRLLDLALPMSIERRSKRPDCTDIDRAVDLLAPHAARSIGFF